MVWMDNKEIELIDKYLNKDKIMLEYGSGGSTLYFSKFVKEYYSIEHNKLWYDKIKGKTNNSNININFCDINDGYNINDVNIIGDLKYPSNINDFNDFVEYSKEKHKTKLEDLLNDVDNKWNSNHINKAKKWSNLKETENFKIFKNYIEYPKIFNKKFDLILIDGRSRPECVRFVYNNNILKENGIILIHDFWTRPYYYVIFEKFEEVESASSLIALKKI